MSNQSVRSALSARLVTLPLSPALLVLWENSDDGDPQGEHLLAQLVPLSVFREFVDSDFPSRHTGELQVTAVVRRGLGTTPADAIVDAVCSHFYKDLVMESGSISVRITDTPKIISGYESSGWWLVPVLIPYITHF